MSASSVTVAPRRRCACCRVPSNRCPCKVCEACTTSGGPAGADCACGRALTGAPGALGPACPGAVGVLVVEGEPGALSDLPSPGELGEVTS
jgi:hypothetical protein